jgi:hypothetical protein
MYFLSQDLDWLSTQSWAALSDANSKTCEARPFRATKYTDQLVPFFAALTTKSVCLCC